MRYITLVAFISPFLADRTLARSLLGERFIEIYIDTPLEICEQRDPKGLYKKARSGKLINFTGIDSDYEPPVNPDLVISTHKLDQHQCVALIEKFLCERAII